MPIRTVKQRTDRGKIKDLARSIEVGEPEIVPSPFELRMKKLFEFAQLCKDTGLQSALGFITTDYIADKNALPLTAYRIRQMISDIKSKSSVEIDRLSQDLSGYMKEDEISQEAIAYITRKKRIKTASARKPLFWRASRK
jgi:hypothetical protein